MHAPLARHLVRFPRVPTASATASLSVVEAPPVPSEPTITLTIVDFEARLAAARNDLRASLEAEHAARHDAAEAAHAAALAAATADSVARRDAEEGAALAAEIASAVGVLNDSLAEQLARTLKPLLAEAVVARTTVALVDAVARVLSDPDHPALTIRGPASRLAALQATLGVEGMTYQATEGDALSVTANGIRIEARAAAALAALADSEEV